VEQRSGRTAWLWFVIGGVFILMPGVGIIYFLASNYPFPSYVSGLLLVMCYGPPFLLVTAGLLVIAYGLSRRLRSRP